MQNKLERMHDDLRSLIPAANGFTKNTNDGSDLEEPSTNDASVLNGVKMPEFEIEYVGMDDSAIGTGRVSIHSLFKHFL